MYGSDVYLHRNNFNIFRAYALSVESHPPEDDEDSEGAVVGAGSWDSLPCFGESGSFFELKGVGVGVGVGSGSGSGSHETNSTWTVTGVSDRGMYNL